MKRAALAVACLAYLATACGLKVPATLIAGSDEQGALPNVSATSTGAAGNQASGSLGNQSVTGPNGITPTTGPTSGGVVKGALDFANETEGVTNSSLTICGHVPITGAAPIPHNKARFGQFYFDYVNKEKGGIFGRQVNFRVFDDGYYPAGARTAIEQCSRMGAFIYWGAAGTDQIVSIAKWAEGRHVPYVHGSTSERDLSGFKYSVSTGPSYEYQSRLLADYLVKRHGTNVKYGMIRINSPYFQSGHDAFIDQLKKHGVTIAAKHDKVVQKDERNFSNIYVDFQSDDVKIINNFTTPTIWIQMLAQKPATYDPLWSAISPVAGYNIVAAALKESNSRAEVFQTFNPSCNCTYYNTDLDESAPWAEDEKEFLRIFKKYSPEQDPPPDDFDYAAYLGGKAFERILRALGPQPTRTKLFTLLRTYKETQQVAFPSCPADFTRSTGQLVGGWRVNVFQLNDGKWKQIETCTDKP